MNTQTNTEQLRDFANRLILFSYHYENANKSDMNYLEMQKEIFVNELKQILEVTQ